MLAQAEGGVGGRWSWAIPDLWRADEFTPPSHPQLLSALAGETSDLLYV